MQLTKDYTWVNRVNPSRSSQCTSGKAIGRAYITAFLLLAQERNPRQAPASSDWSLIAIAHLPHMIMGCHRIGSRKTKGHLTHYNHYDEIYNFKSGRSSCVKILSGYSLKHLTAVAA
ncbi:MAG: hypothetical protein NZL95_09275 [Chitinophagales bacterium]|nr:hypothetical protein [Chitinophagales bacterium]MDW8428724.1 hypothetical protein [Chitinophagales bacterium]